MFGLTRNVSIYRNLTGIVEQGILERNNLTNEKTQGVKKAIDKVRPWVFTPKSYRDYNVKMSMIDIAAATLDHISNLEKTTPIRPNEGKFDVFNEEGKVIKTFDTVRETSLNFCPVTL